MTEERCSGCGYTKYGHAIAIGHMVATEHEWAPHDHAKRCCREHGTHSSPHVGCILR